jgi:putative oxidoreductase
LGLPEDGLPSIIAWELGVPKAFRHFKGEDMKRKLVLGARILLGPIFVVFGLNGFLQFIPVPPPEPAMAEFAGALFNSGYFFPPLKICEITAGVLLLVNIMVPFALILLSPIVVNILCVHIFLDMAGLPMALLLTVLMTFLGCSYFEYFKPLFTKKCQVG